MVDWSAVFKGATKAIETTEVWKPIKQEPIRAYHGSPYDFDRFDMSRINTGEGAQSYGHGLYFAGNPKTAQSYRDALTKLGGHPGGRMYEVDINARPEQFLDWDKSLSQQPENVQEFLRSRNVNFGNKYLQRTGESAYSGLATDLGGREPVSTAMRDAGIPGIKYLDQGSRTAGAGTSNYVVFDDKLIDILRKYGVAGATGAGVSAAGSDNAQAAGLPPEIGNAVFDALKKLSASSPKDTWKPVSIVDMKSFQNIRPTPSPYKLGGKPIEPPVPANDLHGFEPQRPPNISAESPYLRGARQRTYLVNESNAPRFAENSRREKEYQEVQTIIREAIEESNARIASISPLPSNVGPITRTPLATPTELSTPQKAAISGTTMAVATMMPQSEAQGQEARKPIGQAPLEQPQEGAWKPVKQEPLQAQQESIWSPSVMAQSAARPITSYPETYSQLNREARERMSEGAHEIATPGSRASGAWKMGTGALGFTLSPLDAALRTVVGKPVEDVTGIPKEYTEFAASLALPVVGFTSTAKGKDLFKPIENVLSPTTVSSKAQDAAALLRGASGTAARDTAKTEAALEPFQAKINALPAPDRLNFIDYVEGRTGQYAGLTMRDPELQAAANSLRTAFDERMAKIQSLPSTATAQFIDDYFPHFWKDPVAAAAAANNFSGAGKQGSGASLKKRTVPTIADGLAMGLELVTTNPLEATLRYVRSMDHFIATQEALDTAIAQGTVKYFKPKIMGASGHPDSFKLPQGYVALNGRGATRPDGAKAYAPEDWARVYNNFIDRGIHKNADWGKIYDALQSTSNSITALELGLSGYHAFTMANEAVISGVAKGIGEIVGGKPVKAIGSMLLAPLKPVTNFMSGRKAEQVYLGQNPGTPDMRRVVDLLEKAGGRAVGKGHSPDYRFSAMGSYWTAFKRGALKQEMAASAANIRDHPLKGPLQEFSRLVGRSLETVAQPLFETYIPRVKNGAFYDTMHSWLEIHPNASHTEQLGEARKIWDSIDNRFGEVVQDNIFWNKTLKQSAQLAMRSYSWNLGTVREIGGGVKDIADTAIHGKDWSQRANYVVAMPIVVGTMNAIYQKLMAGKDPEKVEDLIAGRTGGEAPGFGQRGTVDERASLPGYQKDVIGWYLDWRREAANKLATGPRAAVVDPLRDADWKGDPIFHAGVPWLQDYLSHVIGSMGPISIKTLAEGPKIGSNIGRAQQMMGIRPAPAAVQDPEGYKRGMEGIQRRREQREKRNEQRQKRLYESDE